MDYLQHQITTLTNEGRLNRAQIQCLISAGDVDTVRALVRVRWEQRFRELRDAPIQMTGDETRWVDDLLKIWMHETDD